MNDELRKRAQRRIIKAMDNEREVDPKLGCWLFTGSLNSAGYGNAALDHIHGIHRIAFAAFHGEDDAKQVMHTCDVRKCFHPLHLVAGDRSANARDMALKGRANKKLTIEQVKRIRGLHESGVYRQKDLAKMFNVHRDTVYKIVIRKLRRHVL